MRNVVIFTALLCLVTTAACSKASAAVTLPGPAVDETRSTVSSEKKAVFAGGCFWGIEAVFENMKGVKNAVSGYAGGTAETAHYEIVSDGRTGHAEAVEVVYDPSVVSYGQLLHVFFSVAHDPTEVNRQGPDVGPQYRSAIFYGDAEQKRIAEAYIEQINRANVFRRRIATEVTGLKKFYPAEAYHQDYAVHHPRDLYIQINDAPKVERLREQFPQMYRGK